MKIYYKYIFYNMVGGTEGQEPGRIGERRRERKGQEVGVSRGQEAWREMKNKMLIFVIFH